ncbi:MAG: hypothetical protein J0I93_08560 [Legionella sp.]|nr:hypothetical protein [Legionella sp.]
MSGLVEIFRRNSASKELLNDLLAQLRNGNIDLLKCHVSEIKELNSEFLKIFYLDDELRYMRAEFCLSLSDFSNELLKSVVETDHKKVLEILRNNSMYCHNLLIMTANNVKKRPLDNPLLPKAKRQRPEKKLSVPTIKNVQEKKLILMGYNNHFVSFLTKDENKIHYENIIKWHQEFVNYFSHQQLVTLSEHGGEEAFLFLKRYSLILKEYNLTANEIMELILSALKTSNMERLIEHLFHMDKLAPFGFNKQHFFYLYSSDNAPENLRQLNEILFQIEPDEIALLAAKSPPQIFLLVNQYLDYFLQLSLRPSHLIQLVVQGKFEKIDWILNNYDWLVSCTTVNPEILCNHEIAAIEQHRLIESPIEENPPEPVNQVLSSPLSSLKNWGFTEEEILALDQSRGWIIKKQIRESLEYLPKISELGYSQEQIKRLLLFKREIIKRLETLRENTPILVECGFQLKEIFDFVVSKSYLPEIAARYSKELIAKGFTTSELIYLFTRGFSHKKIMDSFLLYLPKLLSHGLTKRQIIGMTCSTSGKALPMLAQHFPDMINIMKRSEPNLSEEKLKIKLTSKLKRDGMLFINFLMRDITSGDNSGVLLFPILQKSRNFSYPEKDSYLFLYPREIKSMNDVATHISSYLRLYGCEKHVQQVKEHFALVLDVSIWPILWPNLPAPTEVVTGEDFYDFSLEKNNYYRVSEEDSSAYIFCDSNTRALICANHLNYLNLEVQKSNQGIDEPLEHFKAYATDSYVLIDNYGAYIDAVVYLFPERYKHLPINVDELCLLTVDLPPQLAPEVINAQSLAEDMDTQHMTFDFDTEQYEFIDQLVSHPGSYGFFGQSREKQQQEKSASLNHNLNCS